jgi:uncharacterized membrane protein
VLALTQLVTRSVVQAATEPAWRETFTRIYEFLAPYNEFIVVLFVLWLFARRGRPKQGDFTRQAQEVLEAKFKAGEISRRTYEKYRQDISIRPKR